MKKPDYDPADKNQSSIQDIFEIKVEVTLESIINPFAKEEFF